MTLALVLGILIEEAVDAGSAESSSGDAAAFCARPSTGFVAAANSLDDTCENGSLSCLRPALAIVAAAAAAASISAPAAAAVKATILIASSSAVRLGSAANLVDYGCSNATQTQVFEDALDFGLAPLATWSVIVMIFVIIIVVATATMSPAASGWAIV
jgi:hypothetical protein